jgi:hypothetical protein
MLRNVLNSPRGTVKDLREGQVLFPGVDEEDGFAEFVLLEQLVKSVLLLVDKADIV